MQKLLLTCFLALLCLVGRYLAASSRVADSPGAELLHRSDSPHRGGEILPDTFPRIDFGLVDSDQDMRVGLEKENFHSTSVPVFPSQNKQEDTRQSLESQSLGSWFSPLASKNGLVDSDQDMGAGQGTSSLQPAPPENFRDPVTVLASAPLQTSNQFSLEISGNEGFNLVPNSHGLRSVSLSNPSIVDHGLKNETASSRSGAPRCNDTSLDTSVLILDTSSPVLIYGELINPDSLSPLTLTLFPYGKNSDLERQEIVVSTAHGKFFDGVLDPRVNKFEAQVPIPTEFAYLDLKLGGRSLLEDFIVLPSDSVKIGIDLAKFQIVFGGPSKVWYETQYELNRALKSQQFDSRRTLIELDREALLDQGDNRSAVENQEAVFGARIQILEHGKDATDRNFKLLNTELGLDIPGLELVEKSKSTLSTSQYKLLVSQLVGKYYGSVLSQFRRYDLIVARLRKDEEALAKIDEVLPKTLVHLKSVFNTLDPDFATGGYLDFLSEWAQTKATFTGQDFISVVLEEVPPQFRQRVLGEYALAQVSKQNDHQAFLDRYLERIHENPWAYELQGIRDRVELGIPLQTAGLNDLQDQAWTWDMLQGSPTLVYFYFSTCTHSARYFRELLWPLYQEMAETKGLKLVAVSVDDNPQLWKSAITEYSNPSLPNLNLPATANREWLDHYLIDSYPRAFLLDENGDILSLRVRENSLEKLRERVTTLLIQANNSSENP